jgi:hypothetical protein
MRKLLLCVIAAATVAGCAGMRVDTSPRGQCFLAAGPWEVAQIGIEGAVKSPSVNTEGKATLKQVSQKGTEASRACVEAARTGDGDKVAFYASMLSEATRMGREMALQQLDKEEPTDGN